MHAPCVGTWLGLHQPCLASSRNVPKVSKSLCPRDNAAPNTVWIVPRYDAPYHPIIAPMAPNLPSPKVAAVCCATCPPDDCENAVCIALTLCQDGSKPQALPGECCVTICPPVLDCTAVLCAKPPMLCDNGVPKLAFPVRVESSPRLLLANAAPFTVPIHVAISIVPCLFVPETKNPRYPTASVVVPSARPSKRYMAAFCRLDYILSRSIPARFAPLSAVKQASHLAIHSKTYLFQAICKQPSYRKVVEKSLSL